MRLLRPARKRRMRRLEFLALAMSVFGSSAFAPVSFEQQSLKIATRAALAAGTNGQPVFFNIRKGTVVTTLSMRVGASGFDSTT